MGNWKLHKTVVMLAAVTVLAAAATACTPAPRKTRTSMRQSLIPSAVATSRAELGFASEDSPGDVSIPGMNQEMDVSATEDNSDDDLGSAEDQRQREQDIRDSTTTDDNGEPTTFIARAPRMGIGGCPLYPANNAFHADIRSLETRPDSNLIIEALGDERVGGASSFVWQGSRSGVPINIVNSNVDNKVQVIRQAGFLLTESLGTFPMPASPKIEGYPTPAWDRHLLLFDTATCRSHEFITFRLPHQSWFRTWEADAGHTIDLTSNTIMPYTSTVSGTSLLAGMIRYEELAAGAINHAISITIPSTSNKPGIWPSTTNSDGKNTDPNAPRIGSWLRLKNVDVTKFGPKTRVIIEALQTHGAVITDTNVGGIGLTMENDHRWDDADLATLRQLHASDFEVVDASPMMVSRNSYEIR